MVYEYIVMVAKYTIVFLAEEWGKEERTEYRKMGLASKESEGMRQREREREMSPETAGGSGMA